MILGLFHEAVDWLFSVTSAAIAIATMLLIGLVVGMAAFWVLHHGLRKLAGPAADLDPFDDEPNEIAEATMASPCSDETSPPKPS